MHFITLLFTAVGLSMDAFAVSMCKGLSMRRFRLSHAVIVGLYFGIFQAVMPLIGFFLGINFAQRIEAFDHWVAFGLLVLLGVKMIWEARQSESDAENDALDFKTMLVLSVATSIDALAVGISFAFLHVRIFPAVSLIGFVTFLISAVGVRIGSIFGEKYKAGAEIAGGIILICIGLRILFSHLLG